MVSGWYRFSTIVSILKKGVSASEVDSDLVLAIAISSKPVHPPLSTRYTSPVMDIRYIRAILEL